MNKKYILLFIGVIIIFGIFIGFIAFQQNQNQAAPKPASLQSQNPANLAQTNQKQTTVPTVALTPLTGTAQQAALKFYQYYFSTSDNPLAAGKYKTNPYLSDYFKGNIETGFDNGNIPIFCAQNKRTNVTLGKETQVYESGEYMEMETIKEAPPGNQYLYEILLSNNNGQWLIEDVNCL